MKSAKTKRRVQQIMGRRERRLKVCYGYYQGAKKKHPIINLAGYYLSKFGFDIGDSVELVIEKEQIVIKKVH